MLDRTATPDAGAIQYSKLLQPEHHLLPNGYDLFIINAGDQPVIKFEIKISASIWHESVSGVSWFTAKMLMEGSTQKSANEIASLFDFYGAHIEIDPGFDHSSISLYCLKKHFNTALSLLFEILNAPIFPEKELETLLNIRKQQIRLNNEKNSFITSKNIRKALYGNLHPYGRSLSEIDLDKINVEVLKDQYKHGFFGTPEMFLSGLVGTEEIRVIEDLFGNASFNSFKTKPNLFKLEQTKEASVEKPKSLQSAIKLGWHIPGKNDPDHFNLLVTNEILGGYFGSRLMKNLREEKGLTYGIHAYPIFLQEAAFILIGTEVIAEKTQLAIGEIMKEVDLLKTKMVDAEELKTVTNYMAGSFLSKISTPFHLMDKFQALHDHGLKDDYYQRYFETLQSISPQQVLETANKFFKEETLSTAIAGKV